jgi:hypothetical protein
VTIQVAYLVEATFELLQPHRDVSNWPGSNQFADIVKKASAKINGHMGVDSDVCSDGDATKASETIEGIVANQVERKLLALEGQKNANKAVILNTLSGWNPLDLTDSEREDLDRIETGDTGGDDDPAMTAPLHYYGQGGPTLE